MKTRIAVSSLLLKITLCHQFQIIQRRSAPSTVFRKGSLVFTSGRWSTKTGRGCARYMSERGIWWKTNKSISTGNSGRVDFDETLLNNIDRG